MVDTVRHLYNADEGYDIQFGIVLGLHCRITLGLGGYGIQFGITDLSGNLYINIFVLGLLASPLQFIFIYLQNR